MRIKINLKTITKLSFFSLATLPLLKENYNSLLIIVCAFLVLINLVKSRQKPKLPGRKLFVLTLLFWSFLAYEVLGQSYNFDRVLRYLPFLILPLIFFYRPRYIDAKVRRISLSIFQHSVAIQCLLYLIVFLLNNPLNKLFYASLESIPFFREYVFSHYLFQIHPTYFSAFLLVSFTISIISIIGRKKEFNWWHGLNIVFTLLFIFLFSSKIVLLLVVGTIVAVFILILLKESLKKALVICSILFLLLAALIYPSRTILKERFDEVRTEINKPIVGTYYNSTNTRVAIFKCSMILLDESPFFGYGDHLQKDLNDCYGRTNESEFYKISVFNTHNYYFNLVLYGGWLLLLLFILYVVVVYRQIRYSSLALFLFFQILIINTTENFLSRHYGVVLFNYIICLFIFIDGSIKELNNE